MPVTTPFLEPSRSCNNDNKIFGRGARVQHCIKYLILLIFLYCNAAFPAGESPRASAKDYPCEKWFAAVGKPKGVFLVTHGLNSKPAKMEELAQALANAGYEVLRPSFTGHCREPEELQNVEADSWEKDARDFYAAAKKKADALKVPLYLAAYSFSGLAFHSLRAELPFRKKVLLAPALETKFWYPFAVFLLGYIPKFAFRTQIPNGYYAQEHSGLQAVVAMNHFVLKWQKNKGEPDDGPVLLWVHPGDELVSASGLKEVSLRRGWDYREIDIKGCELPTCYKHLIVDSAAVGKEQWKKMVEGTLEFLAR